MRQTVTFTDRVSAAVPAGTTPEQIVALVEAHLRQRNLSLEELCRHGYGLLSVEVSVQDGKLLISRVRVETTVKPGGV